MKLVNDDDPDGSEEMSMVDLGGNQDHFERFRGCEQAVGGISDDSPFLRLRRVAVPASGPPTDQAKVACQPLLLVVQKSTDRAHVKHREPGPRIGQHLREDREERSLRLSSCGRCQDDEVRSVEVSVDGETLDGTKITPSQGIDDVVLKSRMQAIKGTHRSSSMSSTLVA